MIHYEPMTRSSLRYRSAAPRLDYSRTAVWTVNTFRPRQTFRVSFTLPFKQHNDPKGSNFLVEARVDGPDCASGVTKDVSFVSRP